MALTSELIYEFVKATKDETKPATETTVYGTTVEYDGSIWVQFDGSDRYTPVSTTTDMKAGERVAVTIKNHTATVTGNISSPAARTDDVKEVGGKVDEIGSQISEFEIIVSDRIDTDELTAINAAIEKLRVEIADIENAEILVAEIEKLYAKYAELEYVSATDVEILNAEIENLRATFGSFTDISTEKLTAVNAELDNLKAYNAEFTYVSADVLAAIKAEIENLDVKYAEIDFANIGEAAIRKLFSDSGIIKDLIVSEGHITGELVGVTIKGDLIEAGTLKADRLVVRGSDGNYYKLNTNFENLEGVELVEEDAIHGSVIVAKSITAEKVAVDDLVAFDATIGGFVISRNDEDAGTCAAIYSIAKSSVDSPFQGIYLGSDGQMAVGDDSNYLKYYKTADGTYRLAISAGSVIFSSTGKSVEETVEESLDDIEIGARNLIRNSNNLIFEDYYFYSDNEPDDGDDQSPVTVEIADGVATLTGDPSVFTTEIVNNIAVVTEQYEVEPTVTVEVQNGVAIIT